MTAALAVLGLVTGLALPGVGADPSVHRTEGATIRLYAAPEADGGVRGALVFDLEPGWKTYWADPGEAGLAPSIEFEGESDVELFFPLPARFLEGDATANGYDQPVAIAFRLPETPSPALEVRVFAGLCLDLCVPVSAELRADLAEPLDAAAASAIERAFLALPRSEPAPLRAKIEGEAVVISDARTEGADDVFLRGREGWQFGVAASEHGVWRIPVRSRPRKATSHAPTLEAVLAAGAAGVRRPVEIEN